MRSNFLILLLLSEKSLLLTKRCTVVQFRVQKIYIHKNSQILSNSHFSQGDFRIFESSTHGFMVFPLVSPIRLDPSRWSRFQKVPLPFIETIWWCHVPRLGTRDPTKKSPRKWSVVFFLKHVWSLQQRDLEKYDCLYGVDCFFWKVGGEYVVTVLGLCRDYPQDDYDMMI